MQVKFLELQAPEVSVSYEKTTTISRISKEFMIHRNDFCKRTKVSKEFVDANVALTNAL